MAVKKRVRRSFTTDFKQGAAKRVAAGESAASVAKDIGVSLNSLRSWKSLDPEERIHSDPGGSVAPRAGRLAEIELKHIRQENELLKAENDYLKRRDEILRK
jgi:transposase-like protein